MLVEHYWLAMWSWATCQYLSCRGFTSLLWYKSISLKDLTEKKCSVTESIISFRIKYESCLAWVIHLVRCPLTFTLQRKMQYNTILLYFYKYIHLSKIKLIFSFVNILCNIKKKVRNRSIIALNSSPQYKCIVYIFHDCNTI